MGSEGKGSRRSRLAGWVSALALGLLGASASAKDIQLRFVVWDGNESQQVLRAELKKFEAANPGIKVKLEAVTDYNVYFQKLLAQYAANVAPDVAMMDPPNFQRFARRGVFFNLNDFIARDPEFKIEEYYKPIVDAHSFRGDLFVLPRDIAPIAMIYYNKRLFDRAGIPYPDGTWTWDYKPRPELREKCFTWVMQQLSTPDLPINKRQWGLGTGWIGFLTDLLVFSQGARYADDQEEPTKLLYDDPRIRQSYKFVVDEVLKNKWMPSPTELSNSIASDSRQLFTRQRVAMFLSGIWDTPEIRRILKPGTPEFFEWDVTLAPAFRDGTKAFPTGGSGYAILTSTKHPEASWKLAKWMAGPQGMQAMAVAGIAQPAIRRLALQEPWIPGPNTPKDQQYPASRIFTDIAVPYVVFAPNAEYWPEVNGLVGARLNPAYDGMAQVDTAIDRGMKEANQRLEVLRRKELMPKFNWGFGAILAAVLLATVVGWVYWPERKKWRSMTSRDRRENRVGYAFAMPWILGMLIFTLGPMILSLLISLADWDIIRPALWRGVGNYAEAFREEPRFWVSLRVTFVYTLFAVPLGLMGSLALALLLNVKVKGMPIYRTFFYLPALASAVAGALIWRRIFQPEGGLLNTLIYGFDGKGNFLGLASFLEPFAGQGGQVNWLGSDQLALPAMIIMSLWGVGGGMIILLAGLQGIPQFYYEAATLDGAGNWNKFKAITFPLLTPSLFFSLITGVIGSFQVFTQAQVMTQGGPNDATLFYMLHLYNNAFGSLRMGYASAMAWVLFVIILVFTLLQWRLNKYVYYESGSR